MRTYRPGVGRTFATLLTALLLSSPVACRKPAQPSEAYYEAQTRFGKLYANKGDEAFADPGLPAIEDLLNQVPANSLDAASARELRARIEDGKLQWAARQRSLAELRNRAGQPTAPFAGFSTAPTYPSAAPAAEPTPEPADAGTDAGTSGAPGVGTSVRELASGFSGCFKQGPSITVQGRGMRDLWELSKDRLLCRNTFAALQDQLLIIEDGKVLALAPRSAIQPMSPDGGPLPGGDAGR